MAVYDPGDVITLVCKIRDAGGAPADATSLTCTITLPDGATSSPAVIHEDTGSYTAVFELTLPGRYRVCWLAAGENAGAFTDDFTVAAGLRLLTAERVCAKQRVTVPDPDSPEGAALGQAVEQATGLVLAYLRRGSIDTLPVPGVDAVRAVATRVAARLWRNPTDAASESYGDHSVSWSDPRIFTGDDKTELRPWRKRRARTPIMLTPRHAGETP